MPEAQFTDFDLWLKLMNLWEFRPNEQMFRALDEMYAEPGRHYHTLEHVRACLHHVDSFDQQLDHRREVELALWFHDAIYHQLRTDNEQKSAELAAAFLEDNGATAAEIDRVYRLILVTEHDAPAQSADESILIDIDLSVLGAEPRAYDVFEQAIREEYKMVPLQSYRRKRADVLRRFLERPKIYHNPPFANGRERQARENLSRAIAQLAD